MEIAIYALLIGAVFVIAVRLVLRRYFPPDT